MFDETLAKPSLTSSPDRIMPGGEPIFYETGEIGLLFLHGFTASPYEGRDFAEHFSAKNYAVWVPLLPGHGSNPDDLLNYHYTDWLKAAEHYYLQMEKQYQQVVVCGQSMGGALALHLAANYALAGVITLAASVVLKDWRLKLLPLARRLLKYQYKSRGPDISSQEAKAKSVSYHKYPIKSLLQFLDLLSHVKEELPGVHCPALIIHSRRDRTITYENLAFISGSISSTFKRTLTLENSYHVISVDKEKELIFETVEQFLKDILALQDPLKKNYKS